LHFLDFLIRDPEPAVLLHATGILVTVPAPHRFALHKLIVARRRHDDSRKRDKNIFEAQALLNVLVDRRPDDLREAWAEAFGRGKTWQRLLGEGLGLLHPATRDRVLQTVGAPRRVVPGLALRFVPGRAQYDAGLDEVRFFAISGRESITCSVTRDTLEALAAGQPLDRGARHEALRRFRDQIEQTLRTQ
jgi:hypothetical protein